MNDGFRVAARIEAVAAGAQPDDQLPEVVDFAIEDDPHRAILIPDRLTARVEVDDAEPPHSQAHAAAKIKTFVIRSAMHNRGAHGAHFMAQNGLASVAENSRNAAHRIRA